MQDMQARLAGDARLAPFAGRLGWQLAFVGVGLTLVFVGAVLAAAVVRTANPEVLAIGIDFRVFWAAGQLALQGEPLAAFDTARLASVHGTNVEEWMPWLYPPAYLIVITPLGALSFSTGLILTTGVSIAVIGLALWPFAGKAPPLWIALTFAPAYLPALMIGQNSLFWMAGLLAALAALRAQRWVLAGVCIGCLTLKPQLGLMIPFALLAVGAWGTILAAVITTFFLAALPTLVYGAAYWPLLLKNLDQQASVMMGQIAGLPLMVGPLSLMSSQGVPPEVALIVQWGLTGAAALAVFSLWRSRRVGFDTKVAGLLAAILISSPYLWYYEAALMAGIALFALRAGLLAGRLPQMVFFVLFWLGPGPLAINVFLDLVDQSAIGAVVITPLLLISLALCLRQLFRRYTAPHPSG